MNFKNFFDYYYWTHQPYIAHGTTLWIYVGGFLFLIIAGLVCRIVAQYNENKFTKKILRRFSTIGTVMGFLGLLWMFFRQERVAFLAWRFWLLVWLVVIIWWLYKVIWYALKRAPEITAEEEKRRKMEKYLPGRG